MIYNAVDERTVVKTREKNVQCTRIKAVLSWAEVCTLRCPDSVRLVAAEDARDGLVPPKSILKIVFHHSSALRTWSPTFNKKMCKNSHPRKFLKKLGLHQLCTRIVFTILSGSRNVHRHRIGKRSHRGCVTMYIARVCF